jgi:NAD(P)-dependent dehydrogenase (short-subunit alcohol dehydrogenase family)
VLGPGPLLSGRRAVVTGGGGGIGRGIATLFAQHGASVVVAEVDASRADEMRSVVDVAVECDVTTAEGVAALVDAAGDDVDVLVNNVGHYLFRRHDFAESTEDEWEQLHSVNLLHVLRCTRAFLPAMLRLGRGSIVNVSTVEAFRAAPQHAVYSAYKAAITGFTRTLAMEVGNAGVRVNAIAPDLTQSLQVPYDRWVPPGQEHLIPTWVPVGRFGTADDVAGVALFLASDLSAFVTGTTVHADGGSLAAGGWFRTDRGGWTNRPLNP